jgi:plastocyanin
MSRNIAIVVVIVVVVAFAGYYLVSGMGSGKPTTSTGPPPPTTIRIASGTGASGSLTFSPASIKVVVGTNNTIEWVNNDSVTHTVTFTSAPSGVSTSSLTDPNNLVAGGTYSLTLTTPGTYQYACAIHPWMKATITVMAA